jgi:hypothetical protein
MHADDHPVTQGGELRHDTAAIIGHTLDLQEKVVKDAMTSIDSVFMLSIEEKLDYATLTRIHKVCAREFSKLRCLMGLCCRPDILGYPFILRSMPEVKREKSSGRSLGFYWSNRLVFIFTFVNPKLKVSASVSSSIRKMLPRFAPYL